MRGSLLCVGTRGEKLVLCSNEQAYSSQKSPFFFRAPPIRQANSSWRPLLGPPSDLLFLDRFSRNSISVRFHCLDHEGHITHNSASLFFLSLELGPFGKYRASFQDPQPYNPIPPRILKACMFLIVVNLPVNLPFLLVNFNHVFYS